MASNQRLGKLIQKAYGRIPSVKLPGKLAKLPRKAIFAGAGAVALLLLMYLGAKLWFSSAPAFASDLRFLPSNCVAIGSASVDQIVKSQAYQDVLTLVKKAAVGQEDFAQELEIGLSMNDITRVTFGVADNGIDSTLVITTNKPITAGDLKKKMKRYSQELGMESPEEYKERQVGNYTMHQHHFEAFCVVDPNTIVFGMGGPVERVLKRDKDAEVSADMQAALNQVDQARPLFVAINVKGLMAGSAKDQLLAGLGPAAVHAGKVDIVTLDAAIGNDTQLNVVAVCQDGGVADEIRKMAESLQAMGKLSSALPPDLVKLINAVKIAASGNKVTGSAAIPLAMLAMAVDASRPKKVTPSKPTGPPIVVKAEALTKEYHANPAAADKKYKGKLLEVEGKVSEIAKNDFGDPFVRLKGIEVDGEIMLVQCEIDTDSRQLSLYLKVGVTVKVRGECEGLDDLTVDLRDCALVK